MHSFASASSSSLLEEAGVVDVVRACRIATRARVPARRRRRRLGIDRDEALGIGLRHRVGQRHLARCDSACGLDVEHERRALARVVARRHVDLRARPQCRPIRSTSRRAAAPSCSRTSRSAPAHRRGHRHSPRPHRSLDLRLGELHATNHSAIHTLIATTPSHGGAETATTNQRTRSDCANRAGECASRFTSASRRSGSSLSIQSTPSSTSRSTSPRSSRSARSVCPSSSRAGTACACRSRCPARAGA